MSRVQTRATARAESEYGNKRKQKDEDFVPEKRRVTRSGVHKIEEPSVIKNEGSKQKVNSTESCPPLASLLPTKSTYEDVPISNAQAVGGLRQPSTYEALYDAFVRLDSAVFARVTSDQRKIVWFTSLKGVDGVDIEVDHLATFAFLVPDMFSIASFQNQGKKDIRIEPLIIGERPEILSYDELIFHLAYYRAQRAQIMRARLYFLVHFFHASFVGTLLQVGSNAAQLTTAKDALLVARSMKDKVRDAYSAYQRFCGDTVGAEYQTELVRLLQDGTYDQEVVAEKSMIFKDLPRNWLRVEKHDHAVYCECIARLAKQLPRNGTPAKNRAVPVLQPTLALHLWHFAFPLEKLPQPPKRRMDYLVSAQVSLVSLLEERVKTEKANFSPTVTPTSSVNTSIAANTPLSLTFLGQDVLMTNHGLKHESFLLTPMTPCLSEGVQTPTATSRTSSKVATPKSVVREQLSELSYFVSNDNVNVSMQVSDSTCKFYVPSSSSSSGLGENEAIVSKLNDNVREAVLKKHYERKEFKKQGGLRQVQLQRLLEGLGRVTVKIREYQRGKCMNKKTMLACSMKDAIEYLSRTHAVNGYSDDQYSASIQAIASLAPECMEIETLTSGYMVLRHNMEFNLSRLNDLVHELEREQLRKLNTIEKSVDTVSTIKSAPTKRADVSFDRVVDSIEGAYDDNIPSLLE